MIFIPVSLNRVKDVIKKNRERARETERGRERQQARERERERERERGRENSCVTSHII